jgi:SAM-dependent methyltransferase
VTQSSALENTALSDLALSPEVTDHNAVVLGELSQARHYRDWLWSRARPYLGRQVLEVGAGLGHMTECIADRDAVIALELVPQYAETLRKRFSMRNVEVVEGDARSPEVFRSIRGRIDSAMSFNVLEHIDDDRAVLANVLSCLPRGGLFVCFVPAFPSIYGVMDAKLGHVRRYRRRELVQRAREVGFSVRFAEYMNLVGYFAWLLSGRILRSSTPAGGSRAVAMYDSVVVPAARWVEKLGHPPFGQSLFAVLEKPSGA